YRIDEAVAAYVLGITSDGPTYRYAAAGSGAISWTDYKIWNEGNDGSGSGLDADVLDGMAPATGATANTIMQRDASGRSQVAAPSADADIATFRSLLNKFGASGTTGTLDWNDTSNLHPGTGPVLLAGDASNGPGPGYYFHVLNFEYDTKDGTGNILQLALPHGPFADTVGMYTRGRSSGVWSSWKKLWSEVNDGSGSGLDADLLDGSHKADITKLSAMATVKLDGNTEVSANNETVVNIEDYSAEHKFFQLSAYGPLINMTAKICYGAKVTAAEAVEACEHVVIVRNRASSYEELYLINGSTNAITFYYKVYKYTE
ncbi:MAG: pyocin knob domain-containing protein, partial [Eubacteriales bacterium]